MDGEGGGGKFEKMKRNPRKRREVVAQRDKERESERRMTKLD